MTSLAAQLQRLAVPHTKTVLGQGKQRPSLLFDPKEAANLDREAIFALGSTGLEELENIDDAFIEFESSLFNQSSTNWERSLQTKQVNEQLDETITKYLLRLSPYFLLKSAHKTLEWLIYRYHIHQYNVEAIMQCILPYHETRIFVRLLQLLPLSDPANKWHWLQATAKGGAPLARATIVNHCVRDPGFLNFLCDMVPKYIKVHGVDSANIRSMVSFYTCTLLGTLQHRDDIREALVGVLVPSLLRGLKSKCVDFKAGAYMVLSQLVTHTNLQTEFLNQLLPYITKYVSVRLTREALVCLTLMYETQTINTLPKKCFKYLCRIAGLVPMLAVLTQSFNLAPLLKVFLSRLIPLAVQHASEASSCSAADSSSELSPERPQYTDLLQGLLTDVPLEADMATSTAQALLTELTKRCQHDVSPQGGWQETAAALLGLLERRYSAAFDVAVETCLSQLHHKQERHAFREVLSMTSSGPKHQIVPESSTSLLLSLNHANEAIRVLAVQHLGTQLAKGQTLPSDFLHGTLLSRLSDDSLQVTQAVLDMGQLLTCVIAKEELIESLLSLTKKSMMKNEWRQVTESCLKLLCSSQLSDTTPDLSMKLLPSLLVSKNTSGALLVPQTVLNSPLVAKDPLLKGIGKYWSAVHKDLKKDDKSAFKKGIGRLNAVLLKGISTALGKMAWVDMMEKVCDLKQRMSQDKQLVVMVTVMLCECLHQQPSVEHTSALVSHLLDALALMPQSDTDASDVSAAADLGELLPVWTRSLAKGQYPVGCCVWALRQAIAAIAAHSDKLPAARWWNTSDTLVGVTVRLLDVLMKYACQDGQKPNVWRTLTAELVEMALNPSQVPSLLSLCWTLSERDSDLAVSATLKVGSLYMLAHHWKNCPAIMVKAHLTAETSVLACLLLALVHPHVSLRRGALACFSVAHELLGKDLGSLGPLVKKFLKRQEEVTADAGHVSYVISNVFSKSRAAAKAADGLDQILEYVARDETPVGVKERLLVCLEDTHGKKVLSTVTPFGLELVKGPHDIHQVECLRLVVSRLDPDLAADMTSESEEFKLLQAALATKNRDIQIMALGQVTRMLFENLPDVASQRALVSAVLDVAEETNITEIANKAHRTLKQMKLDGRHVQHEIQPEMTEDGEKKTVKGRRRTRKSSQTEAKLSWKRVTILLEALQSRKTITDSEELVYTLFNVLNRLMTTSDEEVEYRKRLILSCMHNMTSRWVTGEIQPKQENFHMSSLVECVRSSASPHTQQQALMVMASVANFFPDYILHNVMLIFTFVGSGLLRQDDSHSFQVITHTITTVIPALIQAHQSSKKSSTNLDALIGSILQVFIDARNAVPRHRCLMVFHTLTETLGPDKYLWMVLALLMESSVQGKELEDLQEEGLVEGLSSSVERDLEFGVSISEQFPAATQVKALTQLLQFLEKLTSIHFMASTAAKFKSPQQRIMDIDVTCLNPQQLRLFQFHLTKIIPVMLTKEAFVNQVLELLTGPQDNSMETDDDQSQPDFQAFLEQALHYVICVAKMLGPLAGKPAGRFWKALLGKTYEVLDKVLYLMPLPQLLRVSSELLHHKMTSVRRKALDLLNTKLQTLLSGKLDPEEEEALLHMVSVLVSLVQEGHVEDDNDSVACRQMALFSLKLLCKVLGSRHTQEFAKLLPLCVSLMKQKGLSPPVLGSCLLCVAELCSTLKAHAIPHLNSFVPPLLKILLNKPLLTGNELLLTCGLTALHRLVTSLPLFLSPFLLDILTVVCEVSSVVSLNDPNKKSQPSLRLKAIRHQLSTTLAPRVLVPALGKCFAGLLQKDQSSLVSVLLMTEEHVRAINREDLVAQQGPLTAFFCQTLDIRNAETQLSEEGLSTVEDSVVSAILAMVVRLSETDFRPMFYKLYDWACREDSDINKNRKLAFFKLAHNLSVKLRSLFNLFVRHTLQAAAKTLDANNSLHGGSAYFGAGDVNTAKSCLLLQNVLDCLHQCMLHDTDGLFQKEVFKILLQPLVDQIENSVGGDEAFEKRISDHLCPCIGQFASASNEDASWKSLNYQVLLKMRHTSPRVRFAALQVVEAIAQKLGEEYMILIPETVPFLAELMEDDVEEVEQRCQQVIGSMEEVLGESLQKYF